MPLPRSVRWRSVLLVGAAAILLPVAPAVTASSAPATAAVARTGPCDLYAAGGTPCVAAHSTTRALSGGYNGPLYQVRRASDGTSTDITPVNRGGYANAAAQDSFCAGTTCVISVIYDQSGHGNNLTQAPPGGFDGPATGGYDNLADAAAAPVKINGRRAYGVYVAPGTGYRDNTTQGIATGDDPEGMYAVLDGTHANNGCCFDYGNAETDSHDDGNGTMEAIYFGTNTIWGRGTGTGPWIMADLENGLFSGVHTGLNNGTTSISDRFVTAMVKGTSDLWATRGGNAQTGGLTTYYTGARPNEVSGYNPMHKQGAIILGIGGDNSTGGAGTFYEGVMTSGYPSEATENAVQANITAQNYTARPTPLSPGPRVSIAELAHRGVYVGHQPGTDTVATSTLTSASPLADRQAATFVKTTGLGSASCNSYETVDAAGTFLRHQNFVLHAQPNDGGALFAQDATFCARPGNAGKGISFESVNYPGKFLRAYSGGVYLASNGGSNPWDTATNWASDSTFVLSAPLAPAGS